MDRKELESKNKTDLVTLGTSLGFAVTPAMTKPQIVDMLSAAPDAVSLSPAAQLAALVANADDPEKAALQAAKLAEAAAKADERKNPAPKEGALRSLDGKAVSGRKYWVTILNQEGEVGDVKLGINGHMLQIKRGVPVLIDEAYLGVLENTVIETRGEENGSPAQKIQRYAYQVKPA